MSAAVQRRLVAAILDGQLLPGERLHDDELTSWLGMSRTPIRTALERMSELGLVESAPNRFTRVVVPTAESHRAVLEVCSILHTTVAESVVPTLTDHDVEILRDHVATLEGLLEATPSPIWTRELLDATATVTSFFSSRCANPVLLTTVAEVDLRLAFSTIALRLPIDRGAVLRCAAAALESARDRDATVFAAAIAVFLAPNDGSGRDDGVGDGD